MLKLEDSIFTKIYNEFLMENPILVLVLIFLGKYIIIKIIIIML